MSTTQDIAKLLERFDEPLRNGRRPAAPPVKLPVATAGQRFAVPQADEDGAVETSTPVRLVAKRSGLPRNAVISAVAVAALVPLALLFVQLWQDMMAPGGHEAASPTTSQSGLEVALTSPQRIDASGGDVVAFPIVIDATAALPARSIVAVTAVPQGAVFSQGRPYGDNGWSLRTDEIAGLRLRLPAQSDATAMHLELVAGDGTVLARSQTELSITPAPPQVAMVDDPIMAGYLETAAIDSAASDPVAQVAAIDSTPTEIPSTAAEEIAQAESVTNAQTILAAEETESAPTDEAPPPPPAQKPSSSADNGAPTVNTVKTVSIAPPRPTKPHDGAMALGAPADEPQGTGEWMETKTAVDMHAKAEQSSDTVKVAQGGVKMRVMARDNRWIQVNDPTTSTTGWIYDRFLTPTDAPAQ
ncbi:MAG: hypothetical protein R3D30_09075 [Hyphomicrobiales bacterium]